jgi:hypothetical protein
MPADSHGCGHYRMIWPADVLNAAGLPVRIFLPDRASGLDVKVDTKADGSRHLSSVVLPHDCELLVLQRPANELHPQLVRMVRKAGIPVVIDMDDDMSAIHPNNDAFHHYRSINRNGQSWRYAAEACKEATLVTTSTTTLQKVYAKHGRGRVLDNFVPDAYLHYEKGETGRFGWAGTTASHPDDLQVTGRAVPDLMKDGHSFTVVGGRSKVKDVLRLPSEPRYSGVVGVQEWARTIAAELDVGMAPLAASAFNRSKSRLKCIEMMSVGVPWVSSPREEYRKLHKESGCGLLADTPRQWHQQLKLLLTNEGLRKEQAEAGKTYMKDQTYQANAWRWWEAWQDAIKLERS